MKRGGSIIVGGVLAKGPTPRVVREVETDDGETLGFVERVTDPDGSVVWVARDIAGRARGRAATMYAAAEALGA